MSDDKNDQEDEGSGEGGQSMDELFSGEETTNRDPDIETSQVTTGQNAAEISQAMGEQVDWNKLIENLEDVTNLIREYFEQSRENKRVENKRKQSYFKHQRRVIFTAAGTFLTVISISAVMTFYNALSGDAFTFVLGTLFGAILTFLQNMIGQNEEET